MGGYYEDSLAEQYEETWWTCENCGLKLAEKIDENRVKILGLNAQEYEIGFNYIKTFCKKCGKENNIKSSIPNAVNNMLGASMHEDVLNPVGYARAYAPNDDALTPQKQSFFVLSQYDRKKLLKGLTEKQKKVFQKLIEKEVNNKSELEKAITEIAKELKLSTDIVKKDTSLIIKKIKEITTRT